VCAGSEERTGRGADEERLEAMLEFLVAMSGLSEEILRMPTGRYGAW